MQPVVSSDGDALEGLVRESKCPKLGAQEIGNMSDRDIKEWWSADDTRVDSPDDSWVTTVKEGGHVMRNLIVLINLET